LGPKIKVGAPDFPRRPLADTFLYRSLVRVNVYKCAKFQLPSFTSFRDKEADLKFNLGATTPCRTSYAETFMCVLGTWQRQTACQISASYLYASCNYANMYFPQAYHYNYVPKNGFFLGGGRVEGEDVKLLCSDPQKALPCVNTRLLMYRMSKSVHRPEL